MSRSFQVLAAVLSLLLLSAVGTGSGGDGVDSVDSPSTAPSGRVIVLGMDGMDAAMAADWMDAGQLPNFARLRDAGTFAPLMPANPAQSPVSWATLNTGRNPGKHSIYDFVGMKRQASRKMPVIPDVGFQRKEYFSAEELGLPHSNPNESLTYLGYGAAAGVVLLLVFLKINKVVGIILALGCASGGYWYGLSFSGIYPKAGFQDFYSLNLAQNFWVDLDDAGIPFRGQGTIVSYPVQELEHGQLVAGLGAPDATGGLNSSAIYTTASERKRDRKTYDLKPARAYVAGQSNSEASGGKAGTVALFQLEKEGDRYHSKVFGPSNASLKEQLQAELNSLTENNDRGERFAELNALFKNSSMSKVQTWVPMEVTWTKGAKEVGLTVDSISQSVAMDSWSEFFRVEFPWNPHFSTWGMVRFYVEEIGGELEMYASPLQIDPDHPTPGSRVCWPPDFASGVAERIGPFETLGWACQTHAMKDAELSDDAFLADIEYTLGWRTRMLKDALSASDWKVLFHFFGTPDRICHMLMRHMDPRHPQYDQDKASREVEYFGQKFQLKDAGLVIYQEMDKVVGYLLDEVLGTEDTLMIVSDHGFDSFRRQVDLNAWLAHEGFLSIRNRTSIQTPRSVAKMNSNFLQFVDWPETQAYSMAIGKIYLNLKGREAAGSVTKEEADAVLAQIVERLYQMTDPQSGEKMVKKVYLREDLYDGPYVKQTKVKGADGKSVVEQEGAAEITIDFVSGYRASWNVTAGGITLKDGETEDGEAIAVAGDFVFDNDMLWSGDHCGVDIHEVQGIFFSNRKTSLPEGWDHYDAVHLAPTVLDLCGVKAPKDYDAGPLGVE